MIALLINLFFTYSLFFAKSNPLVQSRVLLKNVWSAFDRIQFDSISAIIPFLTTIHDSNPTANHSLQKTVGKKKMLGIKKRLLGNNSVSTLICEAHGLYWKKDRYPITSKTLGNMSIFSDSNPRAPHALHSGCRHCLAIKEQLCLKSRRPLQ